MFSNPIKDTIWQLVGTSWYVLCVRGDILLLVDMLTEDHVMESRL
jgi:hypothetical protein